MSCTCIPVGVFFPSALVAAVPREFAPLRRAPCAVQKDLGMDVITKPRPVREKRGPKRSNLNDDDDFEDEAEEAEMSDVVEDTWVG